MCKLMSQKYILHDHVVMFHGDMRTSLSIKIIKTKVMFPHMCLFSCQTDIYKVVSLGFLGVK